MEKKIVISMNDVLLLELMNNNVHDYFGLMYWNGWAETNVLMIACSWYFLWTEMDIKGNK
jgi:hypothetical protein